MALGSPRFIRTVDISTTLNRRIDTPASRRAIRYDRISGRSRDAIPCVRLAGKISRAHGSSRSGRLSANFDYICQSSLSPPALLHPLSLLIPPRVKYRHVPTPYSWTLSTEPAVTLLRRRTAPPIPLDSLTAVPSDLPSRRATQRSPVRFHGARTPCSRLDENPWKRIKRVGRPGNARCNCVSRYVSRLAKVRDENAPFTTLLVLGPESGAA